MPEVRRQFTVVSADGREFKIVELASYRWERNAEGVRCPVENEGRDFYTADGRLVVPTEEPFTYRITELGVIVKETVEPQDADTSHDIGRGEGDTLRDSQ